MTSSPIFDDSTHVITIRYRHPVWIVRVETEKVSLSETVTSLANLQAVLKKLSRLIITEEEHKMDDAIPF